MILTEAYDYMDLLLDKADQPYFTTQEKDKFLNLAISDFINFHYQKMTADEDSRRAISGCIDYQFFTLTAAEIIDGDYVYNNSHPALSLKYMDEGIPVDPTDPDNTTYTPNASPHSVGYFIHGNQYVFPKQHLYTLSVGVGYYNYDDIIDSTTGLPYAGVVESDIVAMPLISAKNVSARDYYENSRSSDPFNRQIKENGPQWVYVENRIVIGGYDEIRREKIRYINIQSITLPTINEAFAESTDYGSSSINRLAFAEHYQKQILQLAVEKMTQVDVGLMTPPS